MALCSMCPGIQISGTRAPGHGWVCVCGEANCTHYLNCAACRQSRYQLEQDGRVQHGRPVLPALTDKAGTE